MRQICSRTGCHAPAFIDDDKCFNHRRTHDERLVTSWLAVSLVLTLIVLGVLVWAVIELVQWVTTK